MGSAKDYINISPRSKLDVFSPPFRVGETQLWFYAAVKQTPREHVTGMDFRRQAKSAGSSAGPGFRPCRETSAPLADGAPRLSKTKGWGSPGLRLRRYPWSSPSPPPPALLFPS